MNSSIDVSAIPGWLQVVLVVLVAVQLGVEIFALVRLFRTPDEQLVLGKKWPWVLIILFVNLIGAVVFLVAGRKPVAALDPLAAPPADAPPATPDRASRAADVLYGSRDGDAS